MRMEKSTRNGERIVAAIRERIFNWEYPPNHPLGEEQLSREFGVSRSPVREALRSLEAEGLVHRINSRSYFVRQFKTDEVAELYVVRMALELYAVEHLAQHPETHDGVRALAQPWLDIREGRDPRKPDELAKVDETFHEQLAELTGNQMLLRHLQMVNARLFAFRAMDFTLVMEQNKLVESCDSHLAVIAAIVAGNPEQARQALRSNLVLGMGNVDKAMGRILAKTYNS